MHPTDAAIYRHLPRPYLALEGPNRRTRRAIAARKRTVIKKHVSFGRIVVTAFVTDIDGLRDRIEYTHIGRGKMSRVLTDELLFSLQV